MSDLRVIIIDDDRKKREMVKNMLPDYIVSVAAGSSDGAIDYLKRDAEGNLPDLVILNGDDPKNFGLYVYDWMINKSGDAGIASIPVIVLTQDEFSDASLEFLELGDVSFYEGEIDESELFSKINDAIEEAEFLAEPIVPSYEETKNIDRLMGRSVKAPGDRQRAVVIDMETRFSNLEAALERGRSRVTQIKTLLDAAQRVKGGGDDFNLRSRKKVPKDDAYVNRMSLFLEKARKKQEREEELARDMKKQIADNRPAQSGQVIKNTQKDQRSEAYRSVGELRVKAMNNPSGAFNAQSTIRMDDRPKHRPVMEAQTNRKTVVVVDADLKTRKLCSLFLQQKYNVATFDSGMKTIDYFVKNHVDLLIINPVLSGMGGKATVASLRMQPNGASVPVMYLVGDDYTESRTGLLGAGVVGILNKPIKQGVIAQSVDGFFDTYR